MADERTPGDELVALQVPRRYYEVVIRALADAIADDNDSATSVGPSDDGASANRGWDEESIASLKQKVQNPTVRLLLDTTANQPDQWLRFRDLMQLAQRTYGEARGDLAGFTQLIRRQFERDNWPLQFESSDDGQLRYRMSPQIAQWWLAS